MGPKTKEIASLLRNLVAFLERYDEQHWSSWIARDLPAIENGDFRGVEHSLSACGGMGSLHDLLICPTNGHEISEGAVPEVNQEFRRIKSNAWTLENEIRRVAEYR